MSILPRLIRYRDAPSYCGMDRSKFDADVRPKIEEIPIGKRGIAFDRLDLDAWVDDYKTRNGRPSRKVGAKESCEHGQRASNPPAMAERLSTKNTGAGESSLGLASSAKTKRNLGSGKNKAESTSNLSKALNAILQLQPESI